MSRASARTAAAPGATLIASSTHRPRLVAVRSTVASTVRPATPSTVGDGIVGLQVRTRSTGVAHDLGEGDHCGQRRGADQGRQGDPLDRRADGDERDDVGDEHHHRGAHGEHRLPHGAAPGDEHPGHTEQGHRQQVGTEHRRGRRVVGAEPVGEQQPGDQRAGCRDAQADRQGQRRRGRASPPHRHGHAPRWAAARAGSSPWRMLPRRRASTARRTGAASSRSSRWLATSRSMLCSTVRSTNADGEADRVAARGGSARRCRHRSGGRTAGTRPDRRSRRAPPRSPRPPVRRPWPSATPRTRRTAGSVTRLRVRVPKRIVPAASPRSRPSNPAPGTARARTTISVVGTLVAAPITGEATRTPSPATIAHVATRRRSATIRRGSSAPAAASATPGTCTSR